MNFSEMIFVCAGQGAQTVGMGKDLTETIPACRGVFDRANAVLGFDLARLCFEGPESELVKSNICQPAIFAVTAACFTALKSRMPADKSLPQALGGLSLGEWTALYLGGAVAFEDCLRILEARGRFMQEACEQEKGGMLSIIGLNADTVREIAETAGIEIANYNSPGQIVLSGKFERLPQAEKAAKDAGAKRVIPLNVAGAYHSSLMTSAADKLEAFLDKIPLQTPCVPVVSNVTGQMHSAPSEIRRLMVKQVTSSVDWIACVKTLAQLQARKLIECGPGKVLSGLIKRIAPEISICNVQDLPSLENAVSAAE